MKENYSFLVRFTVIPCFPFFPNSNKFGIRNKGKKIPH